MASAAPAAYVAIKGDWQDRGIYGRGDIVRDGNVLYVAFDRASEGLPPAADPDTWMAFTSGAAATVGQATRDVPGLVRSPVFDVRNYGGGPHVGSYTQQHVATNDDAVAAARDAAARVGGGTLYFGPGLWHVSQVGMVDAWDFIDGAPTIPAPNNITIAGAGRDLTTIVQDATAARGPLYTGSLGDRYLGNPVVYFNGVMGGGVRDLTIIGVGAGTSYEQGIGLWCARGSGLLLENVTIRDAAHTGLYFYRLSHSRVTNVRIERTHATGPDDQFADGEGMFLFSDSAYNVFDGLVIDTCDGHGLTIDAGTNITGADAVSPHDNLFTNLVIRKCGQAFGYAGGVAIKLKGARRNVILGFSVDDTGLNFSEAIGFYLNQNNVACEDNLVACGVVSNLGNAIVNVQGGRRNTVRSVIARNIGNYANPLDQMAIYIQGGNYNNPNPTTGAYPTPGIVDENVIDGVRLEQDPNGPFVGTSPYTETAGPALTPTVSALASPGSLLDSGTVYYAVSYLVHGRETAISPLSPSMPIASGQAAVVTLPTGNAQDAVAVAAGRAPETASESVAPEARVLYRCHDGQTASLRFVARINDATTTSYTDTAAWSSLTATLRKYTHGYFLSTNCTVNDQAGATLKAPAALEVISSSATGGMLTNGAVYRFVVTALDAAGHETIAGNEVFATVPGGGTGTSGVVSLTWSANGSSDTVGYNVYRSRPNAAGGQRAEERLCNQTPVLTTGYTVDGAGIASIPPWTRIYRNRVINSDIPAGSTGLYRLFPSDGPLVPPLSGANANILAGSLPILSNPAAPQAGNINLDGSITLSGVLSAAQGVATGTIVPAMGPNAKPALSGTAAATDNLPLAGGSVRGTVLWIPANLGNTLKAYDLSQQTPALLATIATGNGSTPYTALAYGTPYLIGVLKGSSTGSVVIYDVSNLGSITTVATISGLAGPQGALTFTAPDHKDYLAVTLTGPTPGQVKLYDISTIGTPTLVATVSVGIYPWGMTTFSAGNRPYLAVCNFQDNSMSLIDVSIPAAAAVVGTAQVGFYPMWPTLLPWGTTPTLLVTKQAGAGSPGQAVTVDVSAPETPMIAGRVALSGDDPYQPWVQASTQMAVVPVKSANSLDIVSLAVSPPSLVTSIGLSGGPDAVYSQGSRIFATTWTGNALQAYQLPSVDATSLTVGGKQITLADGTNFPLLVTNAGTPTGTPATGTGTLVWDTVAHKLWVFDGSWRGVALT